MVRMSEDSEPLPNLRSIYDTPWVTGKEKKALTTTLGQSFCLIIYMLQKRDVLGLSAYLPSVYEGRCRHYRMVSKLCGMLVTEERVNCLHSWNHVTNKTRWYCCCSLSPFRLFATPWNAARQASLFFTMSQRLLRLRSVELVMPFNHLILCHPLSLFAFNLSQHQGLFQWACSSHHMAKVLELQHQ